LAKIRRACPDQRTLDFVDVSYYTAARRNDVETLRKTNIDWKRKHISWNADDRTLKRRPSIKIDPNLVPVIERLMRNDGPFLFPGGAMIVPFQRACAIAGLLSLEERDGRPAARATPHMLRHSRATHLLWDGATPWQVAGLLGDTVETVMRVYGHHSPEYMSGTYKHSTTIEELTS